MEKIVKTDRIYRPFNYLINKKSGERFQASDFYFYPLSVQDYATTYKNLDFKNYPLMAFIYLTNRCTDNCIGCFARSIEDGNAELEWPVVKRLLEDLSEHGTKSIKLAGREPTAYGHLSECLETAHQYGLKSLVITSASNINIHADAISQFCSHLRVSLNTISQEKHDELHRPSSKSLRYNERLHYVKRILIERRSRGLISGATFLIRENTITDAYVFAAMCKEMGFNYVRFSILDGMQNQWKENEALYYQILSLSDDEFSVIFHDTIHEAQDRIDEKNRNLDLAMFTRVTIHANGKVNACHEGWRTKWPTPGFATYGNINESNFYDIWTGERRKNFIDFIHQQGSSIYCANCKYDSFNRIHRWIYQQVEKYDISDLIPSMIPEQWNALR